MTRRGKTKTCYRCGKRTQKNLSYMGFRYCKVCYLVVCSTIRFVLQEPPFGFPGSSGVADYVL